MKSSKQLIVLVWAVFAITTLSAQMKPSGGIGFFMTGVSMSNTSKAETKLQNPALMGSDFSFGAPGLFAGGRGFGVFNRVLVGGGGYGSSVSGISNTGEASYSSGGGFFNVGYIIKQYTSGHFYAFGGFGGGGASIKITNTGSTTMQLNSNQEIPAGENRTISGGGTGFELGVGFNKFLFGGQDGGNSGFLVGFIAGVNYSPAKRWEFQTNNTAVTGLGNPTNFYFGITIGGGSIK